MLNFSNTPWLNIVVFEQLGTRNADRRSSPVGGGAADEREQHNPLKGFPRPTPANEVACLPLLDSET